MEVKQHEKIKQDAIKQIQKIYNINSYRKTVETMIDIIITKTEAVMLKEQIGDLKKLK